MGYWLVKAVLAPDPAAAVPAVGSTGAENLPAEGGGDPRRQPHVVPRQLHHPAGRAAQGHLPGQERLLHRPRPQGPAAAAFFRGVGQIPIDRCGGAASEAALRTGLRVLAEGELLGLYPEGTRSPGRPALPRQDRHRADGARGRRAGHPRRPDRHVDIQPAGAAMPKIGGSAIRIGKPLDFSRYDGMEGDRFVLRSITDEIMYELMLLSGQEYVDQYATKAKAELEEAARPRPREAPAATRRRRRAPRQLSARADRPVPRAARHRAVAGHGRRPRSPRWSTPSSRRWSACSTTSRDPARRRGRCSALMAAWTVVVTLLLERPARRAPAAARRSTSRSPSLRAARPGRCVQGAARIDAGDADPDR